VDRWCVASYSVGLCHGVGDVPCLTNLVYTDVANYKEWTERKLRKRRGELWFDSSLCFREECFTRRDFQTKWLIKRLNLSYEYMCACVPLWWVRACLRAPVCLCVCVCHYLILYSRKNLCFYVGKYFDMISDKISCFLQLLILIMCTFTVIIYLHFFSNCNSLTDTDFQIKTIF